MRGLTVILAYILGNEKARKWCWDKICEASLVIDKTLKGEEKKPEKIKEIENVRNVQKFDE